MLRLVPGPASKGPLANTVDSQTKVRLVLNIFPQGQPRSVDKKPLMMLPTPAPSIISGQPELKGGQSHQCGLAGHHHHHQEGSGGHTTVLGTRNGNARNVKNHQSLKDFFCFMFSFLENKET